MKKILFVASAGLLCLFISCNDSSTTASSETKDNSLVQKNLDASHIVSKAFETGDPSQIDSVVAADFVDHNEHGGTGNRDSLKAMIIAMHKEDPNGKMDIVKELADDDYVFSLMHFTGTSNGSMGMPAGPYDMHAIQVVRFKDGKAVEHWSYMQPSEMMKMMAPQGKMDNKMNADSSKMKKK